MLIFLLQRYKNILKYPIIFQDIIVLFFGLFGLFITLQSVYFYRKSEQSKMGKNLFRINICGIFAISEEGIKDRVKGRSLRAYSDALRHT